MFGVFHTLAVQTGPQDGGGSGLGVSLEIIAATVIACLLLTATVLLLGKYKRRRESMVLRERQARREMQELCPDGWAARIVLYGDGAPLPDDAPGERKVCVEWTEYESDSAGHTDVAVARRMWARTITVRSAACSLTVSSTPSSRRSSAGVLKDTRAEAAERPARLRQPVRLTGPRTLQRRPAGDDGASGTRTRDLSDANRTLSQLSYGPWGDRL